MGADTQTTDALTWIYDTLKACEDYITSGMPLPTPLPPPIPILKGLPGYAGCQYIGVLAEGNSSTGGHNVINIAIDLWSQETGAATNAPVLHVIKYLDRIVALLNRRKNVGGNPATDRITWSSAFKRDTEKTFFYNVKITVPVHVGGGL